ncbi:MAG: hypothetical protein ACQES2_07695 [Pseudomonadota bacterium]
MKQWAIAAALFSAVLAPATPLHAEEGDSQSGEKPPEQVREEAQQEIEELKAELKKVNRKIRQQSAKVKSLESELSD